MSLTQMSKQPLPGLRYPNGKIIIFARVPLAGAVKTRLASSLGDEQALQVYLQLLRQTVQRASASALAAVEVHVTGDPGHPVFTSLAAEYAIKIRCQRGNNLGQRMYSALARCLDSSCCCLLIGTDCPNITAEYLGEAFSILEQEQDVVIGPAEDGGYVLIGARRVEKEWFNNIPWGSRQVLQASRGKLAADKVNYSELKTLWDIDRVDDYHRWQQQTAAQ